MSSGRPQPVAALLGDAQRAIGEARYDAALELLERAAALAPGDDEVRLLRSQSEAAARRHEAEREQHHQGVAEAVDDVERLLGARELAQAGRRLRHAIDQLGNHPAFEDLERRIDRAKSDLQFRQRFEWAERRSREADGLVAEAAELSLKADFAAAIERLERARELDPSRPDLDDLLGTARAALERQEERRRRAERLARQRRAAAYSWEQAFLYPFRGFGPTAFGALFAALVALDVLSAIPAAGVVFDALAVLTLAAAAGLAPQVVRATEGGRNQLPPWGELAEPARWARDLARVGVLAAVAGMPLLLLLATRPWHGAPGAGSGLALWLALAIVAWLGTAFLVVAAGAVEAFGFRHALAPARHARALAAAGADGLLAAAVVFVLGVLAVVLTVSSAPAWLFQPLARALEAYGLLAAPHLIGVVVRRHRLELSNVYG